MTPYARGALLAMIGTVFYGFLGLSIKAAGDYANVWQIMAGRGLGGIMLAVVAARVLGIRLVNGQTGGMLLTALANFSAAALITTALTSIPIFEALVLWYLLPAWTTLLAVLFLGEQVSRFGLACTAMAVSGAVVVLWPQSDATFSGLSWGHLAGLCSSLAAGGAFVLIRRHSTQHGLAHFFYLCVVGLGCSLLVLAIQDTLSLPPAEAVTRIGLVTLFAGLSQILIFASVAYLSPAIVAVICMGEIVIAAVGAYVLFDERLTTNMAFGGTMIICAAISINWYNVRAHKTAVPSFSVE